MYTELKDARVFCGTGSADHRPERPAVVFVHGAGMDHTVWVMPGRYFARHGYNVVAPDLPGHGRSEGPALQRIEDMAAWLAALLDQLAIDSAAIIGHSMGSLVAMTFAARHPTRAKCLALLGTSTPMPVSEALLTTSEASSHEAIDMANTWSHSQPGQLGGNTVPGLWMLGSGERLLERCPDGVYFADFTACNDFVDGEAIALEIGCPTLVIAGTGDIMTPARSGREVSERIPGAELTVLEGCGHAMLSERPDDVLDALKSIVRP